VVVVAAEPVKVMAVDPEAMVAEAQAELME
jgi:hypothetical protein